MRFRMWRCCFTLDTAEGTGQICTMPQQRYIACSWQNRPRCQGSCAGLACPMMSPLLLLLCGMLRGQPKLRRIRVEPKGGQAVGSIPRPLTTAMLYAALGK